MLKVLGVYEYWIFTSSLKSGLGFAIGEGGYFGKSFPYGGVAKPD